MKTNILYMLTAWLFAGLFASCNNDISMLPEIEDLNTSNTSLTAKTNSQPVTTINDILNWTGTGNNRSVLAIQWVTAANIEHPTDDEIHFLAWGYRWTSNATGIDMVKAIAKKDTRLYVILANQWSGITIKGFGYDGNNDGQITISNTSLTLTQANFVDGVYWEQSGQSFDDMTTSNSQDLWMGGWIQAYASYWLGYTGDLAPDGFDYSSDLVDQRQLENNSWDAWTFSMINSAEFNVEPRPDLLKAAASNN